MEIAEHIAAVANEGKLFAEAAEQAGFDAAIDTCPGWDMRELVRHLSEIHMWAAAHVAKPHFKPWIDDLDELTAFWPELAVFWEQIAAIEVEGMARDVRFTPGRPFWSTEWEDLEIFLANGEKYDVARGYMDGVSTGAPLDCMAGETANLFHDDTEEPLTGEGFCYLVRPRNSCGIGSWGSGTGGGDRLTICP